MNPLAIAIIAEIVKQLPALAIEIVQVLNKEGTEADWEALKQKYAGKKAEDFYK
jgi:hypothetical protein